MYKHKSGIQMDEKGFNESKNITGEKIKNVQHIAYEVVEPMLWNQEKKDVIFPQFIFLPDTCR